MTRLGRLWRTNDPCGRSLGRFVLRMWIAMVANSSVSFARSGTARAARVLPRHCLPDRRHHRLERAGFLAASAPASSRARPRAFWVARLAAVIRVRGSDVPDVARALGQDGRPSSRGIVGVRAFSLVGRNFR